MCGIYGYSHNKLNKTSKEVSDILITALERMEYRGYDSAGISMVCESDCLIVKEKGRVEDLKEEVGRVLTENNNGCDQDGDIFNRSVSDSSVAVAHTRWATHGQPCAKNSHPITSDKENHFIVVHNGIITNHHQIRTFLESQNILFETDTDTECASKLAFYIYKNHPNLTFTQIVRLVALCCDGAFAFVFVSTKFEDEMVAVRRHSPLILGIIRNSDDSIKNLSFQATKSIEEGSHSSQKHFKSNDAEPTTPTLQITSKNGLFATDGDIEIRLNDLLEQQNQKQANSDSITIESPEFFLASDTAAIIEHTRDVIFLQDNDLVSIRGNQLRYETVFSNNESETRDIAHLDTKIESIMMGNFPHFMLKEIFEQPETIKNTMRGRLIQIDEQKAVETEHPSRNLGIPQTEPLLKSNLIQMEEIPGGLDSSFSQITQQASHLTVQSSNFSEDTNNATTLKKLFVGMPSTSSKEHTYRVSLPELDSLLPILKDARRLLFISCGTSYHSSHAVQSLFEELTQFPVYLEIASDFLDRQPPINHQDICFFISQSGETADSLQALNYCKNSNAFTIGLTNTQGSSIARLTHINLNIGCGPEIGVASTKAFTSQYVLLVLIALYISQKHPQEAQRSDNQKKKRGRPKRIRVDKPTRDNSETPSPTSDLEVRRQTIMRELIGIPEKLSACLDFSQKIKSYAESLKETKSILLLGRGYQLSLCLESALKIKELSYIHAEGIVMGELKHGPLALIDKDQKIIVLVSNDRIFEKTLNSISEVVARNGRPHIFCSTTVQNKLSEHFPSCDLIAVPDTIDCLSGLMTIIPMQLLAYHLALARGNDVDKPRNLAKSVTVE